MDDDDDHERSENERWYDAEIAPALLELGKRCEARGMSFFAAVEYDEDCRASTRIIPNQSLAMVMLALCCAAGTNIDRYMINLGRYAHENGIDTSASIFMRLGKGSA